MANEPATSFDQMVPLVYYIRDQRVMLDVDLAKIYGVETKRLKEQFRRNREKFPQDFAFELTRQEFTTLRSQIAASRFHCGTRYMPIAFTEHGAIMAASILNSRVAVEMSVFVVRAFSRMREMLADNMQLAHKLLELEKRLDNHDETISSPFETIRQLLQPPVPQREREMGFHLREEAPRYRTKSKK